jgi:DNA-binding PadR family transcriptional regulator
LLELLAEQPRHGYDLIKELEQRYGGFYRPSPGSVYPTLQLLEEEGSLTSELADGKRVYTITQAGRALLAERSRQAEERHGGRHGPFGTGTPSAELNQLRRGMEALGASVLQVAQHGTPEQARLAAALLDTARRQIYAILARDDAATVEE